MVKDDEIQIVAILPDGQFLGLGLLPFDDVDLLLAILASRDERHGHVISLVDVRLAYERAKALQQDRPVGNNDADDDGA